MKREKTEFGPRKLEREEINAACFCIQRRKVEFWHGNWKEEKLMLHIRLQHEKMEK